MAALDKNAILSADDLPRESVSVPEWGGEVYVRSLMAYEKDKFDRDQQRRNENGDSLDGLRARFAALVIVDEKGDRLFTDAGDITALGKKSGTALDRVLKAAFRLNGVGDAGFDDAKKN